MVFNIKGGTTMKDKSDEVTIELDFYEDGDNVTELSLEDEEALLSLVGLAQEDKREGRVMSSGKFKDKLKKRKEILIKGEVNE